MTSKTRLLACRTGESFINTNRVRGCPISVCVTAEAPLRKLPVRFTHGCSRSWLISGRLGLTLGGMANRRQPWSELRAGVTQIYLASEPTVGGLCRRNGNAKV